MVKFNDKGAWLSKMGFTHELGTQIISKPCRSATANQYNNEHSHCTTMLTLQSADVTTALVVGTTEK
jgi:hypothetical protein